MQGTVYLQVTLPTFIHSRLFSRLQLLNRIQKSGKEAAQISIIVSSVRYRVYNLIAIQAKSTNADQMYVSVNEIKLNLLMQYSALFSQYSPKSQTRSNAVFVIFQRSSTGLNQLIKLCIYNTQYCRSLHRYDSSQSVEGEDGEYCISCYILSVYIVLQGSSDTETA
ncbi:Hypothetical_protein [Hexamita inflata]|uniref:Hypothetical_protein n=1 Tax=Hexamita inflata TaxID=28002 RepID=A0AA86RPP4_9EUKA|nr:Hypothetical protein HINF_LOCUS66011 [Hexamita inflata]